MFKGKVAWLPITVWGEMTVASKRFRTFKLETEILKQL